MMNHISSESNIQLDPKHKGAFTKYCHNNGYTKVTKGCIQQGLKDTDPHIRKEANFAQNAKSWNHKKI